MRLFYEKHTTMEEAVDTIIGLLRKRLGALLTGASPVHAQAFACHETNLRAALGALPADTWARLDTHAFAEEICRQFCEAVVRPGENVGILAAMAIGEKQTQLTLNSFHSAGIACMTVVSGVARFAELMNITSNPKSTMMTLALRQRYASPADVRDALGDTLVCARLSDLLLAISADGPVSTAGARLRIRLDPALVFQYRTSLSTATECLEAAFAAEDMQVSSSGLLYKPELAVDIAPRVMATAVASVPDAAEGDVCEHALWSVIVPALLKTVVAGIPGVKECFVQAGGDDNGGDGGGCWTLQTRGSNLRETLYKESPLLDATRCTSNNVLEIYECLGIEAARAFLVDEFLAVINADGADVDKRHVLLMVDSMTRTGALVSISRYGLRTKASVFARSSFEETAENILRAAAFAETDNMVSVSSNIMAARRTRVGTGACDLLYDMAVPTGAKAPAPSNQGDGVSMLLQARPKHNVMAL